MLSRRDFVKAAAVGVASAHGLRPPRTAEAGPAVQRGIPDVAVIGAGAFGVWTAYHLRKLGASVVLVDQHGPGNSRATSGAETRGVRSSYGDRVTWVRWANEAMARWRTWDEEFGPEMGIQLFFPTGDIILREEWDPWLTDTRANWDALGVPYETLSIEEVAYRYPHMRLDEMQVAVFEENAGVVRARRACESVAAVLRRLGGEVRIARVSAGQRTGERMENVGLTPEGSLVAGTFVFACGPWLPKVLPEVMADRLRTPLGHVYYLGTPPGDNRWIYPHMPSYNFPGVTGWPALPPDYRGFRVRTGGRPPEDPDDSVRWIDERFHDRARQFLAERFPLLECAPLLETRACHYESSVDRNFIVDRHPGLANVWIAGGGSAEGFKFGPVVGEYVARRVLALETDPALAAEFALKPDTFEPEEERERPSRDAETAAPASRC